jgi:hypothetical protein
MGDVIDFRKNIKYSEDGVTIVDPITGETWYKFLYNFDSNHGYICFELWARTDIEAEQYIINLKETIRLDGRCLGEMPNE